jgi:hypothetical protein
MNSGEGTAPGERSGSQTGLTDMQMFGYNTDWEQNRERAYTDMEREQRGALAHADDLRFHIDHSAVGKSLIETVVESSSVTQKDRKFVLPYRGIIIHRLKEEFGDMKSIDLLHKGYRDIRTAEYEKDIRDMESGAYLSELRRELASLEDTIDRIVDSHLDHYHGETINTAKRRKSRLIDKINGIPHRIEQKKAELAAVPTLLKIIEEAMPSS